MKREGLLAAPCSLNVPLLLTGAPGQTTTVTFVLGGVSKPITTAPVLRQRACLGVIRGVVADGVRKSAEDVCESAKDILESAKSMAVRSLKLLLRLARAPEKAS